MLGLTTRGYWSAGHLGSASAGARREEGGGERYAGRPGAAGGDGLVPGQSDGAVVVDRGDTRRAGGLQDAQAGAGGDGLQDVGVVAPVPRAAGPTGRSAWSAGAARRPRVPRRRSASATTPGMTSFSYFSSTMKHSRVGRVSAGPATVCITVETEPRVLVLCLPGADISNPPIPALDPGALPAVFDCAPGGRPSTGTQGLGRVRPGCGCTPPRWDHHLGWSRPPPGEGSCDTCGGYLRRRPPGRVDARTTLSSPPIRRAHGDEHPHRPLTVDPRSCDARTRPLGGRAAGARRGRAPGRRSRARRARPGTPWRPRAAAAARTPSARWRLPWTAALTASRSTSG